MLSTALILRTQVGTPRFYCPLDLEPSSRIALPQPAAHHAVKVLRLRIGDAVTLFNGGGGEFEASIQSASRDGVIVDIGKHLTLERESSLHVCLAQSLSSAERMDLTLQKAVELGVTEIQPIVSERSVVRLSGERAERRARHWQNVVVAACEQCARNRIPDVLPMLSLEGWLKQIDPTALCILLSPLAPASLNELAPPGGRVRLLVGPEGGFSEAERTRALNQGYIAVALGPRTLRTETAAAAALAALQLLWGDLGRRP